MLRTKDSVTTKWNSNKNVETLTIENICILTYSAHSSNYHKIQLVFQTD